MHTYFHNSYMKDRELNLHGRYLVAEFDLSSFRYN